MRKIFLVFTLLLFGIIVNAQKPDNYTTINARYYWLAGKFKTLLLNDTTLLSEQEKSYPAIASRGDTLWIWSVDNQEWTTPLGISGANNYLTAGVFTDDTITLSRSGLSPIKIDLNNRYLKLSDSASMLSTYLRAIDTSGHWITDIYQRNDTVFYILDGTETFAYEQTGSGVSDGDKGDITVASGVWTIDNSVIEDANIVDVAFSKITGTPTTLAGYGITDGLTQADADLLYKSITAYNSDTTAKTWDWARVTGKPDLLNISDTAAMLDTYVQRQELIDTAAAIRADFPAGGGDYNLLVESLGATGEEIWRDSNDTLYLRKIVAGDFILIDTLATGEIEVTVDTASAAFQAYIAEYGNDGVGGGGGAGGSIQVVTALTDATMNMVIMGNDLYYANSDSTYWFKVAKQDSTAVGGVAYDADASDFFTRWETAAGTTMSSGDKAAFNTFVEDLKSNSLWTKFASGDIAPFYGGTAATHAVTLLGNNTLTFNGSPSHTATGVDWDGIDDYAATDWIPSVSANASSVHIYYYSGENFASNNKVTMGTFATGILTMRLYQSTGTAYLGQAYSSTVTTTGTANANTTGGYLVNKESDTKLFWQRNGVTGNINTSSNTTARPTMALWVGALNNGGSYSSGETRECRGASWGLGFTEAEATTYNTLWETLNDALGRGVQ